MDFNFFGRKPRRMKKIRIKPLKVRRSPRVMPFKEFISSGKCTPGNYSIYGSEGSRHGESGCMEKRLIAVLKQNEKCLGKVNLIRVVRDSNKKSRLAREKRLIKHDWARGRPSCNKVPR